MTKTALITGITGQDGSYLANFLLTKNYRIFGISKSNRNASNLQNLSNKINFYVGNLNNPSTMDSLIREAQPDEIYNLASQSYPGESWNLSLETFETNGLSAHRLFNTVRRIKPDCRIYQASSSEMYGKVILTPQNEQTPFNPINPYAAAKLYAHNIANIYRQSYNMFISCGILFNHESPLRPMHFITQKVTYAAACLKKGLKNSSKINEHGEPIIKNGKLSLGNLNAERDWGFAGDYVEPMWIMLQQPEADDFVIGTGQIRTIRQLCETAFNYVNLHWEDHIHIDKRFVRPTETGPTVADTTKAKTTLGWEAKTSFQDLIALMIEKHLEKLDS